MMEFQGLTCVVKAKNSYILVSRSRGFIAISTAFGGSGVELMGMHPLLFRADIDLLG
jgi:hypothetical protein